MKAGLAALWVAALTVGGACSDSLYQPNPGALVGEFSGEILSVVPGADPLCFADHAPITLHYGDVNGLPVGR
jgi:hypothetical protein